MKTKMKYQIVGPASCGVLGEANTIEELKNELLEMHEIDEQEYERDAETGLFVDDDEEAPYTITEWDGEDYQAVCTLRVNDIREDMDLESLMKGRITIEHFDSYEDFAEAHNEDWLEEHLCWVKPNASHDASGINDAIPEAEAEELKATIEEKGMEDALTDMYRDVICVQIDGGHTGREEDTIWYYIN